MRNGLRCWAMVVMLVMAAIGCARAASVLELDPARQPVQLFLFTKYGFFMGALVIGTTLERGRQDDSTALMAANDSGLGP